MNKIRRDSEDIQKNQLGLLKNQLGLLEMRIKIPEMKKYILDGINCSLDLEKEKISQPEDVAIQTIQSGTEGEKNGKK